MLKKSSAINKFVPYRHNFLSTLFDTFCRILSGIKFGIKNGIKFGTKFGIKSGIEFGNLWEFVGFSTFDIEKYCIIASRLMVAIN